MSQILDAHSGNGKHMTLSHSIGANQTAKHETSFPCKHLIIEDQRKGQANTCTKLAQKALNTSGEMISQVRKSCCCARRLGWDKDHNSCCTGCHHLDRDHHCFCWFAVELRELWNLHWLHWFELFSVVGDLQGLVSWAGNQRGSRLKEASPPAVPKPGDPIIFFLISSSKFHSLSIQQHWI